MEKILGFLRGNMVCCLATCSNDHPRASAMEYAVVGDNVFFATSGESIKASNLKLNNKISFSAHVMPKFVTIDGTTAAPNESEIAALTIILFERHPQFKEMIEKGIIKPYIFFKLVPEVVYYNDYSAGMTPTEVIKL